MQSFRRKAAFLLVLIVTAGLMAPAWALARCVATHDAPPVTQAMSHADHGMHHVPAAKNDCGHHCIVVMACAAACFGAGMPGAPDAVQMPLQGVSFDGAPYSIPTARIISPEPHPPRHARI